ncbi:FABP family protein [Ornithinimicrobium sediminis]|uniref:FABP family protein n=1 Tax=Ornithinimicrobium sediminis TaxID=2904603 RepID=UPI001E2F374E|nr:FABP family protein [Ornithinimicrobium sediminis]
MPIEIDPTMHPDLAPLAWMIGRWEGAGVVGYPTIESAHFGQELEVTHDGRPFLQWRSRTWLLDEDGGQRAPSAVELGFWRPLPEGEVELLLTHPTGIVELYYGSTSPAKVELRTDGVLRSPHAKEYAAGHRLYGYVNGGLMWAMDMAAMGQSLQSHVSAELKRVG